MILKWSSFSFCSSKKLLKVNAIEGSVSITGLRKIYDNKENQVGMLNNLKIDFKEYRPLFIPIVTSTIPQRL